MGTTYKEGGRLFLDRRESPYPYPVDQPERQRQAVCHQLFNAHLGGQNYLPGWGLGPETRASILDVGTGEGSWAIDIAKEFPSTRVVGVDVIEFYNQNQPTNCHFDTTSPKPAITQLYADGEFGFVHCRDIGVAISHYDRLIRDVGRVLGTGGRACFAEPAGMMIYNGKSGAGLEKFQRSLNLLLAWRGSRLWGPELERLVEQSGWFADIETVKLEIPLGLWPQSSELEQSGHLAMTNLDEEIESLRVPFVNLGLSHDDIDRLKADVSNELFDTESAHPWLTFFYVTATRRS